MANKKAKGKYHIVMMCCGYVESAMTSWIIYTSADGRDVFKTKIDAVKALAFDMYNKYVDETDPSTTMRCDSCKKESSGQFCSKCGTKLSLDKQTLDREQFADWIMSLHSSCCDSYGDSEYANGTRLTFWPWRAEEIVGAKENEVVLIPENAGFVLADALYDQKPELMDEETRLELEHCLNNDDGLHKTDWQRMKLADE